MSTIVFQEHKFIGHLEKLVKEQDRGGACRSPPRPGQTTWFIARNGLSCLTLPAAGYK